MNLDLSGKIAIVCGSTQGIGKATALQLAKMGANIVLVARNEVKLASVKDELDISKGQKHNYIITDFNFPAELKLSVEEFIKENGRVGRARKSANLPCAPADSAKFSLLIIKENGREVYKVKWSWQKKLPPPLNKIN